ncbi:peptide ABC transporter permease [Lichenifustis flavocetrariae]|uniref:Peptide ABC transporter permease n=1 Tax=Lichenifustis flavocetrariae TaxID=2949735 RepID=A0AA42CQ30_9HYPH|nr:peptide ABC transporter permease [Lichenifustis flavocetrariae]MCW6511045.1 peptide ABC transporter permease [Lichenifustis flavocetrariae]
MSQVPRKPAEDPAIDAGDFLVRVGLTILAILVPVSVVLSRRALFTLVPVGSSLVLIGGLLLPHVHLRQRLSAMCRTVPGLSGLALLAWCALSLAWTPFPADAAARLWKTGGTLGLVALTVALLPERTRTSNIYLFPIGLAVASIATVVVMLLAPQPLLTMQTGDSTPERAALTLVVLVWPAIGALAVRDRWITATVMAVGVTVAAIAAWTSVALAALAIGALTFAVATWNPPRVARVMGGCAVILFLLAPLLPFVLLKPLDAAAAIGLMDRIPPLADVSGSVRIWADVVAAEPLRLVTGHGFDIMSHAIASGFVPAPQPRSILFETWYELGLVGAVLAACFAVSAFAAVGRASPAVAPFLLAELAAGFTVSLWGLDTTQLWWVTFLSVGGLAFVHVVRGQYKTDRPAAAALHPSPAQ